MSIGSQELTTILLSGDLSSIGMEKEACGTLDNGKETITWSNGTQWIVHARDAEDSLEMFVGMNVTNLDELTPAQLKLQMLFSEFDNDNDGLLNYDEFVLLDRATEEDPQQMTKESFQQIIDIVQSVRGDGDDHTEQQGEDELNQIGLDLLDLTCIYVGPVAEMFQTDLNADFCAVFPEEAKVALIFETFDQDEDGFWSPEEEAEYVASTGRESDALQWFRNEDGTTAVGISSLLLMYLDKDSPFNEDLDADFHVAGMLTGFNEGGHDDGVDSEQKGGR